MTLRYGPGAPDTATPRTARPGTSYGRAYCGAAHGRSWTVDHDAPPSTVDLIDGHDLARYRLVQNPVTRQPARDHLGSYVYVPVRQPSRH